MHFRIEGNRSSANFLPIVSSGGTHVYYHFSPYPEGAIRASEDAKHVGAICASEEILLTRLHAGTV